METMMMMMMMMMVLVSGVRLSPCPVPGCHASTNGCEVAVSPARGGHQVLVDWSRDWWDLDLECLHSLTVELNGNKNFVF